MARSEYNNSDQHKKDEIPRNQRLAGSMKQHCAEKNDPGGQ
jgi:hypothetical protein